MTGISPVSAPEGTSSPISVGGAASPPAGLSFTDLLSTGLRQVEAKVSTADAMIQAFAEGQTVPIHQVTLALEQARLAVELASQIRARLVETYREFMTMQV